MGANASGQLGCCKCDRGDDEDECVYLGTGAYSAEEGYACKVRALPALSATSGEDDFGPCWTNRHLFGAKMLGVGPCNVCDMDDCIGEDDIIDKDKELYSVFPSASAAAVLDEAEVYSKEICSDVQESPSPAITDGVPLVSGIETLSPELVKDLLKSRKCVLVDVRGADRASGVIEGALHIPAISMSTPFAARLPELVTSWQSERLIVFFCQFCKHRAPYCANLFYQHTDKMQRVAVMEGGFRAWQSKGLPVQDGGGTASERATADAWALHQGGLIKSRHLGG